MTFAKLLDNFFRGDYPFPMMLFTIIIASVIVVFLSKRMLGKLNIATKTDITQLKGEIAELRSEVKDEITGLHEEIAELRGEMKDEIAALRGEMKGEIAALRGEMNQSMLKLRENDLYHTNKAILLMAKSLIPDVNMYGRIKDSILENTPASLREDIRGI